MRTQGRRFLTAALVGAAVAWSGIALAETAGTATAGEQATAPQAQPGDIPADQVAPGEIGEIPIEQAPAGQAIRQSGPAEVPETAQGGQATAPAAAPGKSGPDPAWLARQNRATEKVNREALARLRSQNGGQSATGEPRS